MNTPAKIALLLGLLVNAGICREPTPPVPPTLEIEVLDPGVDPLGHPAVLLSDAEDPNLQEVEIPPTILVHRYYYTGDRDFQAQLLVGGPSIVVANHPKTGERCYVPVQMLPGAPRVYYTGRRIEYDFGSRGISIVFGLGNPVVRYRNRSKISTTITDSLGLQKAFHGAKNIGASSANAAKTTAMYTKGIGLYAADAIGVVLQPFKQAASLGPLSGIGNRLAQRVEQHRTDKQLKSPKTYEREWVRRYP